MRVLITADIHCGYPGRLDDNIWSLQAISDYATEHGIEQILCLGDMFHNRDSISIDVLCRVHEFFKNCPQEWIIFPGNHDMFLKTSWNINSIKPLEKYARIFDKITSFKLADRSFFIVPFMHYETEYVNKIKKIEDKVDEGSILLTHIGVNNARNNSCFLLKHWSAVNFDETKFALVFAGHFHNHQIIGDRIYYPGSPFPFRFDEGMIPHGFIDFDIDNLSVNFINLRDVRDDCPYDFVTLIDDMLDDLSNIGGHKVRIALNKEYSKSELDGVREKLLSSGAMSVQWMKLKTNEKDEEYDVVTNNEDETPPFMRWLETQDCSKYDKNLLISLYASVSEEAEDLYSKSRDSE